ncbi:MAG TPA: CopG family transcriptional regulator [Pirellulales bacterium]|nr:CopG family transcriptional regulator [Pirellulales bacterium]
MTTFSIELPDNQAKRLNELAVEGGVTPEELLKSGVREWLEAPRKDFAEAAAYVLRKNAELYRRLA